MKLDKNWKLFYLSDTSYKDITYKLNSIEQLEKSGANKLNATVPSTFEKELFNNKIIQNPYYSDNVLSLRKYECMHQWWCVKFDSKESFATLKLLGVDTVSEIIVNGKVIGSTENMFLEYEFPISDLSKHDNELIIHISPAIIESSKHKISAGDYAMKYSWATLSIRKMACSFGWDIMPRIIGGGIWKPVELVYDKKFIEEIHLYTANFSANSNSIGLNLFYRLNIDINEIEKYEICIDGKLRDSTFYASEKLWFNTGRLYIGVKNPLLWNVVGRGEPNLYDVTVTLKKDNEVVDTYSFKYGIRSIKLEKTSLGTNNGKFEFVVNECKVFIKGINWTPVDALHPYNLERTKKSLLLAKELGVNMIRVWGGGVYESEEFYNFCDENGILVWQDFMLACAVYQKTERLLSLIQQEAEQNVKKLRNHPCIALWCGDNEDDIAYDWYGFGREPWHDKISREVLFNAVFQNAPTGNYLSSSPFVDEVNFQTNCGSETHIWKQHEYFKSDSYKNVNAKFISEIGYFSFPQKSFLEKYLSNANTLFEEDNVPTREYATHSSSLNQRTGPYAYRIGRMAEQVKRLFVDYSLDIDKFPLQSQVSGAEAVKYFVEHSRCQYNTNGGIMLWNLIDGWPNISEALSDYDYNKKLAYHFAQKSYSPILFMCDEVLNDLCLFAVNETETEDDYHWSIIDVSTDKVIDEGDVSLKQNCSVQIKKLNLQKKKMYLIEWTNGKGEKNFNHYFTDIIEISFDEYKKNINKIGYKF